MEFPDEILEKDRLSIARRLGAEDGVTVTCPDGFTCDDGEARGRFERRQSETARRGRRHRSRRQG